MNPLDPLKFLHFLQKVEAFSGLFTRVVTGNDNVTGNYFNVFDFFCSINNVKHSIIATATIVVV